MKLNKPKQETTEETQQKPGQETLPLKDIDEIFDDFAEDIANNGFGDK